MQSISKFVTHNKIELFVALSALSIVLGFLPDFTLVYYAALFLLAGFSIRNKETLNIVPVVLLLVCSLSIITCPFSALFKSWQRFVLFSILMIAVFPLFDSERLLQVRYRIFKLAVYGCAIIGVTAVPCYLLGINFMHSFWRGQDYLNSIGLFGGLTKHSMLLGIISSIGSIFLLYKTLLADCTKYKIIYASSTFLSMCGTFVSGSRSAFLANLLGCIVLVFLFFNGQFNRIIKVLLAISILGLFTYPLYRPYLNAVAAKQAKNINKGSTFSSRDALIEHRITEFENNTVNGIGFVAINPVYEEYDLQTGTIETGSSWLSVLSMTGILGTIPMLIIVFKSVRNLYKKSRECYVSCLHCSILVVFMIHMIVEGYIFSAGNFLCFLFWLTLGLGYSDYVLFPSCQDDQICEE